MTQYSTAASAITLNSAGSSTLTCDGSIVSNNSITDRILRAGATPSDWTASTFSNVEIYIPNYTSSTYKSWSADGVVENNATISAQALIPGYPSVDYSGMGNYVSGIGPADKEEGEKSYYKIKYLVKPIKESFIDMTLRILESEDI